MRLSTYNWGWWRFASLILIFLVFIVTPSERTFAQTINGERITQLKWKVPRHEAGDEATEFVVFFSGAIQPTVEHHGSRRVRIRFANTAIDSGISNLASRHDIVGVFPQQDGSDALIDIVANDVVEVILRAGQQSVSVQVVPRSNASGGGAMMELQSMYTSELPNQAIAIELTTAQSVAPIVTTNENGVLVQWSGVRLAKDFAVYQQAAMQHFANVSVVSPNPLHLEFILRGIQSADVLPIEGGYVIILQREGAGRAPVMSLDFKAMSAADVIRAILFDWPMEVLFDALPDTPLSLIATNVSPYRALHLIAQQTGASLHFSALENRWYFSLPEADKAIYQTIALRYADAKELASVLTDMPLSTRGVNNEKNQAEEVPTVNGATNASIPPLVVRADTRSNALFIHGAAATVAAVAEMVVELDQPQASVLVETIIVEIDKEHARNLGVQWGARRVVDYPNTLGMTGADRVAVGGSGHLGVDPLAPLSAAERVVQLPAQGIGGDTPAQLALGWVRNRAGIHNLVNVQISALEAEGLAQVLASPRLVTTNHSPASIEQGVERLFEVSDGDDRAELVSKRAVLGIEVTPHIYAGNEVQMELEIRQDSFDALDKTAINTKRITSTIRARNEETVMLGGIYQKEVYRRQAGVPLVRRVPLLKWLFSNETQASSVRELVVLLTPKIEMPSDPRLGKTDEYLPFDYPLWGQS